MQHFFETSHTWWDNLPKGFYLLKRAHAERGSASASTSASPTACLARVQRHAGTLFVRLDVSSATGA